MLNLLDGKDAAFAYLVDLIRTQIRDDETDILNAQTVDQYPPLVDERVAFIILCQMCRGQYHISMQFRSTSINQIIEV